MTRRAPVAVAVAAGYTASLLALVGCSPGGTRSARQAWSSTTVVGAVTTTTEPHFAGQGGAKFCGRVRAFQDAAGEGLRAATGADQYRKLHAIAVSTIGQLGAVAPREIESDLAVIKGAYDRLAPALQRADYDLAKLRQEDVANFQTPEVRDASARLGAYARQVCRAGG